ncbi:MAG: metallophosphoesterase [Rhodocyclaceae bacterium]|jgi:predicted phosphodiesterase|nr:metallophosphoesterase [Rhodocyclaceae bacterium]
MNDSLAVTINGPALIFGGNYSNLEATRAVLSEAKRLGIRAENVVCTGDVIAYCADPLATVEIMRGSGVHVVMGNCEESLGQRLKQCGCGFEPGSTCDLLAIEWYDFANRMLDDDTRSWMRCLPRRLDLDIDGRRLAVIHGGVQRINEYIFSSTPTDIKRKDIEATGCEGVLSGHCGLPFTEIVDGRLWHNSGAIGIPANDGTPRTWYSTITPRHGKLRIELHPLDYDYQITSRKMHQAGLSERYALALQTGLWPSCAILPQHEQILRGHALVPYRVDW